MITSSTVLGGLGILCDVISAFYVIVPVALETDKSIASRSHIMTVAQHPLPMDATISEKIILQITHENPLDLRDKVEADWIKRFTSDRRRARLSAVFALAGAIFTALSIIQ